MRRDRSYQGTMPSIPPSKTGISLMGTISVAWTFNYRSSPGLIWNLETLPMFKYLSRTFYDTSRSPVLKSSLENVKQFVTFVAVKMHFYFWGKNSFDLQPLLPRPSLTTEGRETSTRNLQNRDQRREKTNRNKNPTK